MIFLPSTLSRRGRRRGKLALLAAAALILPLLIPAGIAPTAAAGETRWSVTVGSHGSHYSKNSYERRSHPKRSHGHASRRSSGHPGGHAVGHSGGYSDSHSGGYSGGYYKQIWVPPVYATHYDACGRAYRVAVRSGYAKQVYVSNSRSTNYQRRGQWGHRQTYRRH